MSVTGLRCGVLIGASAVALSAFGASAAMTHSRTATAVYTGSASTFVANVSLGGQGSTFGAVSFAVGKRDRTITVVGTDRSGLLTEYDVTQLVDRQRGIYKDLGWVCGASRRPIALEEPTAPVVIFPEMGVCGTNASLPTAGTLRVTFH